MANKMIIDASHPEETRVVVLRGNRVEEFDFESASKKQLRGNIYLAKVTRVEPSLQAAFVEYGGNRHGFLAFSEIHPDYYQIPVADRQALLEDEARRQSEEAEEEENPRHRRSRRHREGGRGERAEKRQGRGGDDVLTGEAEAGDSANGTVEPSLATQEAGAHEHVPHRGAGSADDGGQHEDHHAVHARAMPHGDGEQDESSGNFGHIEEIHADHAGAEEIETIGGDEDGDDGASPREWSASGEAADRDVDRGQPDAEPAEARRQRPEDDDSDAGEDASGESPPAHGDHPTGHDAETEDNDEEEPRHRPIRPRRNYKIQEVIKRRQVLLVQVVKEERGNKGAALTTYLSLAGRYSVLMPNTARGGGISRKITNNVDRKRLKEIAQELEVPDGMGIILRTAGAARGKAEVKRDFEYLLRMWEQVRELTLRSSAPMLTYEEGSLIKRTIRDLYNKDIDEVLVAGEAGYREAKDFMRLIMPGHTKNVIAYRDPQPIFAKAGVEAQLDAMFASQVTLKSGGYIVINQTEALVAIDVNSGRSTREHNIEDTALRTNLEASDEIARQLRLRDLAGLIVIDFIDMEEHRNNRSVERRLKDALHNDRARIQIGRISHFGLLEMSRQRIRTGVLEGSTVVCSHCLGAGTVRSTASIALHVLRVVEDALTRNAAYNVNVRTRTSVALYILNQKRSHLRELERRFGVTIAVGADDMLTGVTYHAIERGEPATPVEDALPPAASQAEEAEVDPVDEAEDLATPEVEDEDRFSAEDGEKREEHGGRGERGPRNGARPESEEAEDAQGERGRKRRRRRRGGRGSDREGTDIAANAPQPPDDALAAISDITKAQTRPTVEGEEPAAASGEGAADERPRSRRARGGRGRNRIQRDGEERAAANGEADGPDAAQGEHADAAAVAAPEAGTWQPVAAAARDDGLHAQADAAMPASLHDAAPAAPVAALLHEAASPAAAAVPERPVPESTPHDPSQPKKSGWWKRAASSFGS